MLWRDPDRWVDSDMSRVEWIRIALITMTGILCAIALTITVVGTARSETAPDSVSSCGVVTHREFLKAGVGMTKFRIRELYGARAHDFSSSWAGNGSIHRTYWYREANGLKTWVTYIDRNADGRHQVVWHADWYRLDGTVEFY